MRLTRPRHALVGFFSLLAVVGCSTSMAQRAGQPNPRYLERKNAKARVLEAEVTITAWDNSQRRGPKQTLDIDRWNISQAFIVFPLAMSSASHTTRNAGGIVEFDDRDVKARFKMEASFPGGANFGVWAVQAPKGKTLVAREMELHTSMTVTSYETIYHEDAAMEVDWPEHNFPKILQSTFEKIPYIDTDPSGNDYDMEPIQKLVEKWTNGEDPRSIKPAVLAKWLAGNVVQHVQMSGNGLAFSRTGMIEGVQLQEPGVTARRRRGSPFDMATLLCAVYREAGLPSRVVIGYGLEDDDDEDLEFLKGNAKKEMRAWVEFALYDERDGTVTWIPVDPVRMRESGGSRMARNYMDRQQKYFGTNDELDGIVPFSFHFFPPTTVRSYSASNAPGFWGWYVAPQAPMRAFQSIRFTLKSASVRGGKNRGN